MIKPSIGYIRFLAGFFFLIGISGAGGLFFAVQASHVAVVAALLIATGTAFWVSLSMWRHAKKPQHHLESDKRNT